MGWDDFANGGRDLLDNREIIDNMSKQDIGKKDIWFRIKTRVYFRINRNYFTLHTFFKGFQ